MRGLALDCKRRRPRRIDVHTQGTQLRHLLLEIALRRVSFGNPVKSTNVLTTLLDDSGTVFVPGPLVFSFPDSLFGLHSKRKEKPQNIHGR